MILIVLYCRPTRLIFTRKQGLSISVWCRPIFVTFAYAYLNRSRDISFIILCLGQRSRQVMKVRFPTMFLCNFSRISNHLRCISVVGLFICWISGDLQTAARGVLGQSSWRIMKPHLGFPILFTYLLPFTRYFGFIQLLKVTWSRNGRYRGAI